MYRKIRKDTSSNMHLQNIWYKKCLVYGPFDKWSKSLAFHARVGGFESPRGHQRLLFGSA